MSRIEQREIRLLQERVRALEEKAEELARPTFTITDTKPMTVPVETGPFPEPVECDGDDPVGKRAYGLRAQGVGFGQAAEALDVAGPWKLGKEWAEANSLPWPPPISHSTPPAEVAP